MDFFLSFFFFKSVMSGYRSTEQPCFKHNTTQPNGYKVSSLHFRKSAAIERFGNPQYTTCNQLLLHKATQTTRNALRRRPTLKPFTTLLWLDHVSIVKNKNKHKRQGEGKKNALISSRNASRLDNSAGHRGGTTKSKWHPIGQRAKCHCVIIFVNFFFLNTSLSFCRRSFIPRVGPGQPFSGMGS